MEADQIYRLIILNQTNSILVQDSNGNKLIEINEGNAESALNILQQNLPDLESYKRLVIKAKKGTSEKIPWAKGFCWMLETPVTVSTSSISLPSNNVGGISAVDYIGMMQKMMTDNFNLQVEKMKLEFDNKKDDFDKYVPIIRELKSLFTGESEAPLKSSISGPKKLVREMTEEEASEAITNHLVSISKKIKASQMLDLVSLLDSNVNLPSQIDDMNKLIEALNNDPKLLATALKFI